MYGGEKLKIGIDMLPLKTYSCSRGIGKYTFNLFIEVISIDTNNEYHFYNVPDKLCAYFRRDNTIVFERGYTIADTNDLDLFIITSLMELGIKQILRPSEIMCKTAVIFYDLIPIIFFEDYLDSVLEEFRTEYIRRLSFVSEFDIIYAISETTKRDLMGLLEIPEDRIRVIFAGLDKNYLNSRSGNEKIRDIKDKYRIGDRFIMSTVGLDFRKNISGIFQAFLKIRDDLCLVVVCKLMPEEERHLKDMWSNLELPENQLILTNYVPVEDLITLYDAADVFLFPSLYEGFGLPVLEAMSRGCPVVTSNISSIPEVCENAAIYVDPYKPEEIAQAIELLLNENELKITLKNLGLKQSKKFTWNRVALEVIESFEALGHGPHECGKFPRYKLAYFTPLNPLKSGISDYSEELLPSLGNFVDIDIFVDTNYLPENNNIKQFFDIYPFNEFDKMNNEMIYDLCIYQIGNSIYHKYMLNYITKYPGIVVLHDVTLCGLVLPACSNSDVFDRIKFLKYVFCNYGYNKYLEIKTELMANNLLDPYEKYPHDLSLNFSKMVLDRSILTLVHNSSAKDFLSIQSSFSKIWKINMGFYVDDSDNEYRKRIKQELDTSNKIIISAFGRIIFTKRIDILLYSIAQLIKEKQIDNIHLYLVGELYGNVKTQIENIINDENLGDFVTITGYVDDEEFNKYLKITDICVNLRYPSSGETSATLIKALCSGIPVITTNYAQYKEYPDNCCWKADLGDYEVELLSEYLFELVTNEKARYMMSKNAYKYAKKNNSMERVVGQYLKAIDYAINYKHVVINRISKRQQRGDDN